MNDPHNPDTTVGPGFGRRPMPKFDSERITKCEEDLLKLATRIGGEDAMIAREAVTLLAAMWCKIVRAREAVE